MCLPTNLVDGVSLHDVCHFVADRIGQDGSQGKVALTFL